MNDKINYDQLEKKLAGVRYEHDRRIDWVSTVRGFSPEQKAEYNLVVAAIFDPVDKMEKRAGLKPLDQSLLNILNYKVLPTLGGHIGDEICRALGLNEAELEHVTRRHESAGMPWGCYVK